MEETTVRPNFGRYKFKSKDDIDEVSKKEAKIIGILYARPGEVSTNDIIKEYENEFKEYLQNNLTYNNLTKVEADCKVDEPEYLGVEFIEKKAKLVTQLDEFNSLSWYASKDEFIDNVTRRINEINRLPNSVAKKMLLDSYREELKIVDEVYAPRNLEKPYADLLEDVSMFSNMCVYANNVYEKMVPEIVLGNWIDDDKTKAYFIEFLDTIGCYSDFDVTNTAVRNRVLNSLKEIEKSIGDFDPQLITSGFTSEKLNLRSEYEFGNNKITINSGYYVGNIRPEMAKRAKAIEFASKIVYEKGLQRLATASCSLINNKIFDNVGKISYSDKIENEKEEIENVKKTRSLKS